jgi:hypothetical protein
MTMLEALGLLLLLVFIPFAIWAQRWQKRWLRRQHEEASRMGRELVDELVKLPRPRETYKVRLDSQSTNSEAVVTPSDDDIRQEAEKRYKCIPWDPGPMRKSAEYQMDGFIQGATWMRDQSDKVRRRQHTITLYDETGAVQGTIEE